MRDIIIYAIVVQVIGHLVATWLYLNGHIPGGVY